MIIQKKQTGTRKDSKGNDKPTYGADLSSLTEEQQANIKSTRYRSETDDYEVEFNEKYERNLLKEEAKAIKAENKALKDRISEATDFEDFKTKITKVKDSENSPTKWGDKVPFLKGEHIEHKGDEYISKSDHVGDKDKEPPYPDLYEPK